MDVSISDLIPIDEMPTLDLEDLSYLLSRITGQLDIFLAVLFTFIICGTAFYILKQFTRF